jgi:heme-degrading monooxygenase HmoA
MTAFIKKERLGSTPPPAEGRSRGRGIMTTIESLPGFQAMKESYAQAKEERREALKEKWESNAEVQRWRNQMTPEERTRDAIERMVPTTKEVLKMRNGGKDVSYEDGRKKAVEIAEKSDRQKKDG